MSSKHYSAAQLIRRGLYDDLESFAQLEQRISQLGDENMKVVGDAFEVFIEGYLATHQKLQAEIVWLVGQIPLDIRQQLNLPTFIDVMLVLLIIFMVAAPLATVDIAVDLASSNAEPQQKPDKPIYLTLKPDLTLVIGDSSIARDQLTSALDSATGGNKDDRIFLRADRSVPYGDVMAVMNELRAARYLKVALVGLEIRQAK
jgi:biopolymer transport protein ExbD